jgi:hypothetical protein
VGANAQLQIDRYGHRMEEGCEQDSNDEITGGGNGREPDNAVVVVPAGMEYEA